MSDWRPTCHIWLVIWRNRAVPDAKIHVQPWYTREQAERHLDEMDETMGETGYEGELRKSFLSWDGKEVAP